MNEFYLGNKNLKKRDVKLEWTQDQVAEYIKCANDVVYFCETYVRIVHVDRGLVQFLPYEYQTKGSSCSHFSSDKINLYVCICVSNRGVKAIDFR